MSWPLGRASTFGDSGTPDEYNAYGRVDSSAVEHRPRTVLAAFLAVHALVWTALPALLYYNLPLDLIEAMTYGREWQLGYDKLPPLPWCLGEIVYRLTASRRLALCAFAGRGDRCLYRRVDDGAAACWRRQARLRRC